MHRRVFTRCLIPIVMVAGTLMPIAAFAADDDHAAHPKVEAIPTVEQGLVTAVTGLVVFALVFAVLALKVWPTITKALDERADKIRSEIEAAEMAQQQARQALEQYERNLAEARAKAQKMLDEALAQQQVLVNDLKAKADVELAAMRERARKDIEAAKRTAMNEIATSAMNLSTQIATKILKREVSPRDQQRMVEESLAELGGISRN